MDFSALVEEYNIKYPITIQNVAGIKLNRKHIIILHLEKIKLNAGDY